jgi:hypothetical protein
MRLFLLKSSFKYDLFFFCEKISKFPRVLHHAIKIISDLSHVYKETREGFENVLSLFTAFVMEAEIGVKKEEDGSVTRPPSVPISGKTIEGNKIYFYMEIIFKIKSSFFSILPTNMIPTSTEKKNVFFLQVILNQGFLRNFDSLSPKNPKFSHNLCR